MTCLLTSQVYKEFYAQKVVTSIVASGVSDKDKITARMRVFTLWLEFVK